MQRFKRSCNILNETLIMRTFCFYAISVSYLGLGHETTVSVVCLSIFLFVFFRLVIGVFYRVWMQKLLRNTAEYSGCVTIALRNYQMLLWAFPWISTNYQPTFFKRVQIEHDRCFGKCVIFERNEWCYNNEVNFSQITNTIWQSKAYFNVWTALKTVLMIQFWKFNGYLLQILSKQALCNRGIYKIALWYD